MLILTRRAGESIYVGNDIHITVLSIQGKQIKLGLDVPSDTIVYREEVYKRVMAENCAAVQNNDEDLLKVASICQKVK